jgi:tRNA-dihydrouridine synthase A
VSKGEFGARLMLKPALVAEAVAAMRRRVQIPVTVKCRLGVDKQDSYEFAADFVRTVGAHCDHFIVHARKAVLAGGLSPAQNRSVPPLMYDRVFRLCDEFPDKRFTLNGGLTSVSQARAALAQQPRLHGLMFGRAAYHTPCLLPQLEYALLGERAPLEMTRRDVLDAYLPYCREQIEQRGVEPIELCRPLAYLMQGSPGAKHFRSALSQGGKNKSNRVRDLALLLDEGMAMLSDGFLDEPIAVAAELDEGAEGAAALDGRMAADLAQITAERAAAKARVADDAGDDACRVEGCQEGLEALQLADSPQARRPAYGSSRC